VHQHGGHASRTTKDPSPWTPCQKKVRQPFLVVEPIMLVDMHGHKEHILSAVLEQLKQVPHVYVAVLRPWM